MIDALFTGMLQQIRLMAVCMAALLCTGLMGAGVGQAADFYDQPPVTSDELIKFIDDLPAYRAWARSEKELAHPALSKTGRPDFVYSARAAAKVESMGWKAPRFFCVMGRAAAALALQEKGGGRTMERPMDMPMVTPKEFDLVRRHRDALSKAGG